MSKKILFTSLVACSMGLTACQTTGSKQQSGAITGAVVGGLIGSQFGGSGGGALAAGLFGAALGGLIGGAIGAHFDEQDQIAIARLEKSSARSGRAMSYRSPKTGARITMRPVKDTLTGSGANSCRTIAYDITAKDGTKSKSEKQVCS